MKTFYWLMWQFALFGLEIAKKTGRNPHSIAIELDAVNRWEGLYFKEEIQRENHE